MDGTDFLRAVADFPALVARFKKLPYDLRNELAGAAIERWLEVDPSGAKHWLSAAQDLFKTLPEKEDGQLDTQLLVAIIPHLVRNDPDWGMAHIEGMQGRSKTGAISLAISETRKTDPAKARQMLERLSREDERTFRLRNFKAQRPDERLLRGDLGRRTRRLRGRA